MQRYCCNVCIPTAFLWAQLTGEKYGGCQNCSSTVKHRDKPPWFSPSWVTLPLREQRTSTGVRQDTPPPLQKAGTDPIAYLESITIHFVVLWVHVAEAAMPTEGGPFTTAGEAFWANCSGQRSVQRYLKQSKQGKAIPSPAPSPGHHAKGAFSLHAHPTHPWHKNSCSRLAIPCKPHASLEQLSSRLFLSAPKLDKRHALN